MGSPSVCSLYLIRHGETDWNRDGRWQGHLDVPLNPAGRVQAMRLARRLFESEPHFDALYSSDLRRAWETAEIIGNTLGMSPTAATALREIDLGAWSGKTREEIAREFPDDWSRMQRNEDFPRGGGETFAAFHTRVTDWFTCVAADRTGQTICAVTHGGGIRAAVLHALGLSWADRYRIPPIENASITILEIQGGQWKVVGISDIESIRDLTPEGSISEKNEGDPE